MTDEVEAHITQRYDLKKRLGKGAYGIVWKAVDKKTSEVVALKKIFDAFRNQTDSQRTFREIAFLQAFADHPNVVKLHEVIKAENDRDLYLAFEFMETDLHSVIKRGNILKDIHKRYIMHQLFCATKYLHSANVIHRDHKPSNVLLDSDCHLKLCDFGLARSLSQSGSADALETSNPLTEYVATRWYRAPEILLASHKYTKGVDLWSLGCILAEMLLGKPLFPGSSTINQLERILQYLPPPTRTDIDAVKSDLGLQVLAKIQIKQRFSLESLFPGAEPEALDLVRKLLVFNPDRRLTADDSLRHPYVRRFHNPVSEMVVGHDIVPPVSDNEQLTISEYRNRLYEMIRNQKIERSRKRKESKAKSVKSQVSSAVSRDGGANSAAPAREQQAEPKQPGASGNGLEQSRAAELQHAHNSELHDHQSQSQSQLQAGALAREQREREATSSFASSGGTLADSRGNGPMSGEQSQTSYGSFLQHEQYELQKAHSHNGGGGGSEEQSSGYQSGSLQNKRLSNSSLAPLDSGAQSYKWGAAGSGRHSPSAPNAGRDEPYHQHQSAVEPEQQTMFARPANGSNHSSPYLDNSTPAMDEADAGYARPVDRVIARADQILRDSARGMPPDKSSARRAAQKADARDAAVAAAAAAMDSGEKAQAHAARRTPSKFDSSGAAAPPSGLGNKQRASALLDDVFGSDHLEFDARAAAAKQQSAQQNHSQLFGGRTTPAAAQQQHEDTHYSSFFGKGASKTYASGGGAGVYKPSIVSSGAGAAGGGAYRAAAALKTGGQQASGVLGAYARMQSQSQSQGPAPAGHHTSMKLLASKPPLNMGSRPPPAAGSNKSNLSKSRSYDSVVRAVSAYPAGDYRALNAPYGMLDEQSLAELRRQQSAPVRFSPAPTPIDMLLGGGMAQGRPPAAGGGLVSRVPGGTAWGGGAGAGAGTYDAYSRAPNGMGTNPYASPMSMRRQMAGATPKFSGATLKAEQVLRDSFAALSRLGMYGASGSRPGSRADSRADPRGHPIGAARPERQRTPVPPAGWPLAGASAGTSNSRPRVNSFDMNGGRPPSRHMSGYQMGGDSENYTVGGYSSADAYGSASGLNGTYPGTGSNASLNGTYPPLNPAQVSALPSKRLLSYS